ncbi:MAG: hypothetical protein QW639_05380 [Candidatus Bathyarchaeia archaeon]
MRNWEKIVKLHKLLREADEIRRELKLPLNRAADLIKTAANYKLILVLHSLKSLTTPRRLSRIREIRG